MKKYIHIKQLVTFFLLFGTFHIACGQSSNYFSGYEKELGGRQYSYHSLLPTVTKALILRGTEGHPPIRWKTEVIPTDYSSKYITYVWVFGMGKADKPATYHLSINGEKYFTFHNPTVSKIGERKIKGDNGAELNFETTAIDKSNDAMGFVSLKVPTSAVQIGKPAIIQIEALHEKNNAWYMTFKASLSDKIQIRQNKVVVKKQGSLYYSVNVDFIHVGAATNATVTIDENESGIKLKTGFNSLEMTLPKVEKPTSFTAEIKIDNGTPTTKIFTIEPVKEWEIFLVQHTHTDIGYTRPQTEILSEHLRYIDNALDYCDYTDDYPENSKFRWTCETSWSVREYLNSRSPEQIKHLLQRVKEGRIEVTGMFLNYSEIIDESALAHQTKVLKQFKNNGIDVTTAMQNDVNGIGWGQIEYFHNTGMKYLTMGIHAHRARKPFDKPTTFWWQAPSGKRLMAYRSEHYMHGNVLSLTTGPQDVFRTKLSNYLTELEEKEYPYDKISLQFSGYFTDNSPPSVEVCDLIRAWNEKYEYPKLRSALAKDFMEYVEEEHSETLPVKEKAWPDWWTDGVGSAANETKVVRNTQVDMTAITGLMSMGTMMGIKYPEPTHNQIDRVYDNILFYDEHTHGAAESVSDPLAENTITQWGMKSSYAWNATNEAHALLEKALAGIEPTLPKTNFSTITVFNTLNWKRDGIVDIFLLKEIAKIDDDFIITDKEENSIPYQEVDERPDGVYVRLWVKDIPAVGYKMLKIGNDKTIKNENTNQKPLLENQYYKIIIDKEKTGITSIYDKQIKKNLIEENDTITLGQVIYEQMESRRDLERLTHANRDTAYRPLTGLTRDMLTQLKIIKKEHGAIYNSIFLNGQLPICADKRGVTIEVRLYHYAKRIELVYSMFKLPIYSPEAVYVAFPFHLDRGNLAFEVQGGIVYPGINQLAGSSSDWNTIQNFATVQNDNSQIVFVSNDIPLVQFGDINTGRYYYKLKPKSNSIYSWVLNNYWVTNFKASQKGELKWRYNITSSADNSTIFATKFGMETRTPIFSRIILPSKQETKNELINRSLINLDCDNIVLVNVVPTSDRKGIMMQLREVEGKHCSINVDRLQKMVGASSIEVVNVLEENIQPLTKTIEISHFETKFIKIGMEH